MMQPEDLIKLVTWKMPYGKYKGLTLCDLPEHYVGFIALKMLPQGELGQLILLLNEMQINGLMGLLNPLKDKK